MRRIMMASLEAATPQPLPPTSGIQPAGAVTTAGVITDLDRPLRLWRHTLAPGARLRVDRPAADQLFYVWSGALETDTGPAETGAVLVVEHGAQAQLMAGPAETVLLHFQPGPDFLPPARPGGQVHLIGPNGILQNESERSRFTLYVDASCPTCTVHLHRSSFRPHGKTSLHLHTADEILVVLNGELLIGRRALGRGWAIAIDKDTQYAFEAGPEGLEFINYRAVEAAMVHIDATGQRGAPVWEREIVRQRLAGTA
jgi:quercetin dioxygenase-like cupin family protein